MSDQTAPFDGVNPEALEVQARERLARADLTGAAALLQQAARRWEALNDARRAGSCWLLAASTLRLAGSMNEAAHAVHCAEQLPLPDALRRGVDMELAEQALACGDAALARERFAFVLERHAPHIDDALRAVVLQRRAVAANASHDERAAAADFCAAADVMHSAGHLADAEAARLAAASCLSAVDPAGAEALWREIDRQPPLDGAGAARRGLVGGHVALQGQQPALALARYGAARQGALDARDGAAYLAASVQSASLLEQQGQVEDAYARLASAWVTLGDLLGKDAAASLVRPALQGLRDRLGEAAFQAAREGYAARRRRSA